MTKAWTAIFPGAAAAVWLLAGVPTVQAAVLLGNDFRGARIYDVDSSTGATSNPRPTGLDPLADIEYNPGTGTLYGLTQDGSAPTPSALFTINIATGTSTLVGSTGLRIIEGDLALNPATGGLYGVQHQVGTSATLQLFTINLATGTGTIVGTVSGTDLSGLSFDNAGNLFVLDTGLDRLLRIDPATGAELTHVDLSLALGSRAGMDIDPGTGTMYVVDGGTLGTNGLYTLDTATGALTLVGPTGLPEGLAGLTVIAVARELPVPSAPEPSTAFLLGLGVLGVLGVARRR